MEHGPVGRVQIVLMLLEEIVGVDFKAHVAQPCKELLLAFGGQDFHHVLAGFIPEPRIVCGFVYDKVEESLIVFQQLGNLSTLVSGH